MGLHQSSCESVDVTLCQAYEESCEKRGDPVRRRVRRTGDLEAENYAAAVFYGDDGRNYE